MPNGGPHGEQETRATWEIVKSIQESNREYGETIRKQDKEIKALKEKIAKLEHKLAEKIAG